MLFYWLKRLWVSILLKQRCQFPLSANFTCRFSALSNCVDIISDGAFLARIFWFFFSLGSCSLAHKTTFFIQNEDREKNYVIKVETSAFWWFYVFLWQLESKRTRTREKKNQKIQALIFTSCLNSPFLSYAKIKQTKMLVTCQRFGDLFLYGLGWQYSTHQNQYNKGRFKVMASYTVSAL